MFDVEKSLKCIPMVNTQELRSVCTTGAGLTREKVSLRKVSLPDVS